MGYFYILRWIVALSLVTYNAAQVCLTYSQTRKNESKIKSNYDNLAANFTSNVLLSQCMNYCISGNTANCTISFNGNDIDLLTTDGTCTYYDSSCGGCLTDPDDTSVVIDFWCSTYDCGLLTAPVGVYVNDSNGTTTGSVATYSCNPGYVRSGPATTECGPGGTWSSAPPSCTPVDCGTLTDPVNGTVDMTSGTMFDDVATFSCDEGFMLIGANEVTCDATGNWSFPMPSCVPAMKLPNPRGMVKASNFTNYANFTVLMETVTNAVRCVRMCTRQMADAFVNGGLNACSLVKYESTSENCTMYYRDNVGGESVNCEDSDQCFVFEDQWFTM